jgi:protein-S-isoprenylcysteine O-methyltransferase Ste14
MDRTPVTLEGKVVDYAFALVFAVMGSVPLLALWWGGGGPTLAQFEALASMPLAFLACYSFIIRSSAKVPAYTDEILVPLLSFLSPILLLNLTLLVPASHSDPWLALLFLPGLIIALLSFIALRHSFAVLPSVRGIVTNGPYRWVRHPLYLGEAIYVLGMMLLAYNLLSILGYLVCIALMMARIQMEERKLLTQEEYREYALRVRYRLLPYIY